MDRMYYVWRLVFPASGEVLMSSRPYSSLRYAKSSLKVMARWISKWHEDPFYFIEILAVSDFRPSAVDLDVIQKTAADDEIILVDSTL